jgi:hypothetical protein
MRKVKALVTFHFATKATKQELHFITDCIKGVLKDHGAKQVKVKLRD